MSADIGGSLDIWGLLMSSALAPLGDMGAILDSVTGYDDGTNDACDGESFVNSRLAARAAIDSTIAEVKKLWRMAEFEVPHVFEEGNVVYLHNSPFPHFVVCSGYGLYRLEVRIRRWDEPDRFESGHWRHHEHIILLEINDTVMPDKDITVATDDRFVIAAGTHCRFSGFDADGDVQLRIFGPNVLRTVFDRDFLHFNIR